MIEINESNFEQETSKGIVLLDFYTTSCGPCRMQTPVLEQCESFVKVCKIDGNLNYELASRFNVRQVPTLVVLQDGVEVRRTVGFSSKEKIEKLVNG